MDTATVKVKTANCKVCGKLFDQGYYNKNGNWAYSPALHLQPLYIRTLKNKKGMFPKSEKIMQRHFHLPLHMKISIEDAHFIGQSLLKC